jgi:hypothetical protein
MIKLELSNKRSNRKYSNNLRLNNTLLNGKWVIKEIREEIKEFLEFNENSNHLSGPLAHRKGSLQRKVYSHDCIC